MIAGLQPKTRIKTEFTTLLCLLIFGCCLTGCGESAGTSILEVEDLVSVPAEIPPSSVAFVGVNLIPMDANRVVENQTVIIEGGTISEIGPTNSTVIPDSVTQIVAGGDWYLMPGLADMHVHLIPTDESAGDLFLFLANGVTTIRIMWGNPLYVEWREEIERRELLGPTIYSASPGMDGPPGYWPTAVVSNVEEARARVAAYKTTGYDFVKVYNLLTPDIYDAIIDEANNQGLPVIGHIPRAIGFANAVVAGQYSMEHLLGYAPLVTSGNSFNGWAATFQEDEAVAVAQTTKVGGLWNCPTMTVIERSQSDVRAITNGAPWHYISPDMQTWLRDPLTQPGGSLSSLYLQNRDRMVRVLEQQGADLLLGTDTGVQYVLPGFSIHEELANLVEAGLTPYQALKAGTANAAEFLKAQDRLGTIAVGCQADLVLLGSNPLSNVDHFQNRVGIMAQGHWFSELRLREKLEELALSYGHK